MGNIKENDNYKNIQDFFNYIFGEDVFTVEDSTKDCSQVETHNYNQTNTISKPSQEYTPQIGDEVIVTSGSLKGIKGKIIAEVEAFNKYQIQLDELNALYISKDMVKIIKRKDNEKVKKIKELKNKIQIIKQKRDRIENELNILDEKLDDTYKELEELED